MSLVEDIKSIQRAVGAEPDGIFGPRTAQAVLFDLSSRGGVERDREPAELDERTRENIAKLDPKARDRFVQFALLAKATAATFGCDYIMIGSQRSWNEQDALYAQPTDGKGNDGDGRIDEADEKVTNARGGESNHNFGIAGDFGVFRGKSYLDSTLPALARQVHAACAVHARKLGFEWGGDWKGKLQDLPHFEISTCLTMAEKRKIYAERGSVL